MSKRYFYRGWEYERGNHLFQSKRHIFASNSVYALCGRAHPYEINARRDEGIEPCKRCEKIADAKNITAE
jgi:hypothetical protein